MALWLTDGILTRDELLDDEPETEPTESHYVQRYPLFDTVIDVKTVEFRGHVIENFDSFLQAVMNEETPAEGYCATTVEEMTKVSNQDLCHSETS